MLVGKNSTKNERPKWGSKKISIGTLMGSSEGFIGIIDELCIFNKALTEEEIATVYGI